MGTKSFEPGTRVKITNTEPYIPSEAQGIVVGSTGVVVGMIRSGVCEIVIDKECIKDQEEHGFGWSFLTSSLEELSDGR